MGKIALLFPGQGAQHVGMGRQIAEKVPRARELFEAANRIVGYDLAKLCFEGPATELDKTDVSQPAIFVTSLAALEMLKAERPEVVAECQMAAGLSLGEYTALVFAGALSFEDGLRVVQKRGQAMQAASEATPSGMVSLLLLGREKVEEVCRQAASAGLIRIANYLCPGNTVVSGVQAACVEAVKLAEQAGGKPIPLAVAGAFHTTIMQPADQRLAEALAQANLQVPRIPVYSNVDARPHEAPDEIREILVKQVLSPVLWEDSVRNMLAAGTDRFFEVGPGKVLRGLLKRIDRKADCQSVNDSP
ncbi:MAG: ACP S-malonyltransferase [Planctomycetia bacterium]|nr:ACP S-malonyltransferase [Planctomycetia bacterium]